MVAIPNRGSGIGFSFLDTVTTDFSLSWEEMRAGSGYQSWNEKIVRENFPFASPGEGVVKRNLYLTYFRNLFVSERKHPDKPHLISRGGGYGDEEIRRLMKAVGLKPAGIEMLFSARLMDYVFDERPETFIVLTPYDVKGNMQIDSSYPAVCAKTPTRISCAGLSEYMLHDALWSDTPTFLATDG